jgi:hypothetical protein
LKGATKNQESSKQMKSSIKKIMDGGYVLKWMKND